MASATARSAEPSRTDAASNGRAPAPEDAGAEHAGAEHAGAGPAGGSLDLLLTEGATGPLHQWFPGRAGLGAAARLAARPDRLVRRGAGLAGELARIAAGRSEVAPAKGDRRFRDPAWQGNPAFRRLCQAYLAAGGTVDELLGDCDLDWRAERRVRFAAQNLVDALAPSNFATLNPAVYKAVLDTGGRNLVRGARHFARDMARPPRIPAMVDEDAFTVGDNVAVTPGEVVLRTSVFELIQYRAATASVRERPLLIVPPMINKYYVTDLTPGRSLVEHLVGGGQAVFAMSWRNPDAEQADWGLDTYGRAVIDALEAVEAISRADAVHALGLCAGGIVLAATLAHLAALGEADRVAGLTLGVCVLDNARAGTAGALVDPATAAAAVAESARRGYLDGRTLAGVFAWLRPNDLIWNYWINNYLLGKDPPAFDVLFWNADTTRMPAALHRDFMRLSLENTLVTPGRQELLGTPVDLRSLTMDAYVVAGIADHITPWESCYRTTQLLGSDPRFVLSTSGHIAAVVNPPGNERASYQTNPKNPPDSEAWLDGASKERGTWWTDWAGWLGERSGGERRAPRRLGGRGYQPLEPAPGSYVRVK